MAVLGYNAQTGKFFSTKEVTPSFKEPPSVADVIAEEQRRLQAGKSFTVAGYDGTITLKGTADVQSEVTSQATVAQVLLTSGSDQSTPLRGVDGAVHHLTPTQMLDVFTQGAAWVAAVRAARWAIEAMDPIPQDYADDKWWP
jgi:hypothetical protein